jgi:hypothetical protein
LPMLNGWKVMNLERLIAWPMGSVMEMGIVLPECLAAEFDARRRWMQIHNYLPGVV